MPSNIFTVCTSTTGLARSLRHSQFYIKFQIIMRHSYAHAQCDFARCTQSAVLIGVVRRFGTRADSSPGLSDSDNAMPGPRR